MLQHYSGLYHYRDAIDLQECYSILYYHNTTLWIINNHKMVVAYSSSKAVHSSNGSVYLAHNMIFSEAYFNSMYLYLIQLTYNKLPVIFSPQWS